MTLRIIKSTRFLFNTKLDVLNPNAKIYAAFAISNILHKQRNFKKSAEYLKIANYECLKQKKSDYSLKIKNAEFYRSLKVDNQIFKEATYIQKHNLYSRDAKIWKYFIRKYFEFKS